MVFLGQREQLVFLEYPNISNIRGVVGFRERGVGTPSGKQREQGFRYLLFFINLITFKANVNCLNPAMIELFLKTE